MATFWSMIGWSLVGALGAAAALWLIERRFSDFDASSKLERWAWAATLLLAVFCAWVTSYGATHLALTPLRHFTEEQILTGFWPMRAIVRIGGANFALTLLAGPILWLLAATLNAAAWWRGRGEARTKRRLGSISAAIALLLLPLPTLFAAVIAQGGR